jgi:hypothetical protein
MTIYTKNKNLYIPCHPVYNHKLDHGITLLNLPVYTDKYSDKFVEKNGRYYSDDPKLKEPVRNLTNLLDKPPINSKIPLNKIATDKYLVGYGKNYKNYNDIKEGQILYHVDEKLNKPYHDPNFVRSIDFEKVLYKDPMDSIKPQYNRKQTISNIPKKKCLFDSTWIQDSNEHREDLISKQMSKMNSQRYIHI